MFSILTSCIKKTTTLVPRSFALLAMLLAAPPASSLLAQAPRVEFDVACLTPVTDVISENREARFREVEARIPISILLAAGNQNQLSEVVIRVESRHRQAEVVDFAPRTRLASSVVGNVEVTERGDERQHAEINLFGIAPAAPTIHGKANAGYRNEREAVWNYERLPPHEVLVASGTTDRGFGAFFKFRPSSQASLEGSHDLLLRLRVPRNWRSEIYDVTAIAYHRRGKDFAFDQRPVAGQETFTLVFHQAGDDDARNKAIRMASDEENFRAIVFRDRKSIERKAFPSPLDKVGSVIGIVHSKIPETWYRDLLNGKKMEATSEFMQQLPTEVRNAAIAMSHSRQAYEEMRLSEPPTSSRRPAAPSEAISRPPTSFVTRMASGSPNLSAKKSEKGFWTPANKPSEQPKKH